MRHVGLLAAAVNVVSSAPPVRADDEDYTEQIVFADAGSVGLFVGIRDRPAVGIVSYALLAPAVHLAHGQGDRAIASLAMRAVPVLSIATLERCDGGETALGCALGHVFLGVVGALAVTAIDAFVVADGADGAAPAMAAPLFRGSF